MNKPNNYDNVKINEYETIRLGGHIAFIAEVSEMMSSTNRRMIKVVFDFDKSDDQYDYFHKMYTNSEFEDKKWPFAGTKYILTEDENGDASTNFVSFVKAVEESCGEEAKWGKQFCKWFEGKKVGVVYGEEETEYNGEVKTRILPRYFCSTEKALKAKTPKMKELPTPSFTAPISQSFMNIPNDSKDETIPF